MLNGQFPQVYWAINYVGMIALGLACENVAMVIGQPWTAMWLIFWVITVHIRPLHPFDTTPLTYITRMSPPVSTLSTLHLNSITG